MNAKVTKLCLLLLLGLFLWGCGTVPAKSGYETSGSLCDRLPEFDYRTCWEGGGGY